MNNDLFFTLKTPSEAQTREKGSKFMAFAMPIDNEEDLKKALEGLKKQYFDATHHCYAYTLGIENVVQRANDDGEPAHSAGTPILNQIKAKNLSNTLVVVVRYYGGTKLGVSGLIQAYKNTAMMALESAMIQENLILKEVHVFAKFEHLNLALSLGKKHQAKLKEQHYQEQGVEICFQIRRSLLDNFRAQIKESYVLVLV
ncbi:MAG: YigZ family protein [Cytophagales bacterium]|nr:MAG: YigZ family protein [Cytophagales bacterium]TAF60504.1 MAG: YigZ family protein [Cytophagales bacterium]